MENGKPFIPPNLSKRTHTKMLTPFCISCVKDVDGWLYHREGHTDGTPILTLRCHNTSITIGASIQGAPEFRNQMEQIYLQGLAKIYWNADGTINGPTETLEPGKSSYGNNGTVSGSDNRRSENQALGGDGNFTK